MHLMLPACSAGAEPPQPSSLLLMNTSSILGAAKLGPVAANPPCPVFHGHPRAAKHPRGGRAPTASPVPAPLGATRMGSPWVSGAPSAKTSRGKTGKRVGPCRKAAIVGVGSGGSASRARDRCGHPACLPPLRQAAQPAPKPHTAAPFPMGRPRCGPEQRESGRSWDARGFLLPCPAAPVWKGKNKRDPFFLVLFPRHKEGPACLPWKREDLEPWLRFR